MEDDGGGWGDNASEAAEMAANKSKSQAAVQAALASFLKTDPDTVQQTPAQAKAAVADGDAPADDAAATATDATGEAAATDAAAMEVEAEADANGDAAAVVPTHGNRFRYIKFQLREVNPHIVCKLCAGYFIGATTLMECLHTFCKSCIVKHFQNGNRACPTCEKEVCETNPLDMLRQDRTIQNVVYKIVRNLAKDEQERERAFNLAAGITQPVAAVRRPSAGDADQPPTKMSRIEPQPHDDLINFELVYDTQSKWEYSDGVNQNIKELEKPYIRTSSRATIKHVKRFLAKKLKLQSHEEVDILCRGQLMGREHKLQYIHSTWWRGRNDQLRLEYRQKYDIDQI